jgi:hypothetical protein
MFCFCNCSYRNKNECLLIVLTETKTNSDCPLQAGTGHGRSGRELPPDRYAREFLSRVWEESVFYYCSTFDKAVRVGGGGEWRTCATRDYEPCVFIPCSVYKKITTLFWQAHCREVRAQSLVVRVPYCRWGQLQACLQTGCSWRKGSESGFRRTRRGTAERTWTRTLCAPAWRVRVPEPGETAMQPTACKGGTCEIVAPGAPCARSRALARPARRVQTPPVCTRTQ